jgi:hypothetical protein
MFVTLRVLLDLHKRNYLLFLLIYMTLWDLFRERLHKGPLSLGAGR